MRPLTRVFSWTLVAAPAATAAVEQSHQPVRVGVAVTQEAAEVVGDARYRPAGGAGEAAGAQRLELGAQRRTDALVGVQAQHPVMPRGLHRKLLLRAVARPVALDDARPERGGARARVVAGVGVDHQQLVAEADRAQAGLDAVGFVVGDDARRHAADTRHASPVRPRTKARRIPRNGRDPVLRSPVPAAVRHAHAGRRGAGRNGGDAGAGRRRARRVRHPAQPHARTGGATARRAGYPTSAT